MPIRTHRGRAAVYRRLWGWPLRSPKHLAGAVVVLAVLATAIGFLLPDPPPNKQLAATRGHTTTRYPAEARPSPAKSPPTISVPDTTPPPVPPDPAGLAEVTAWAQRWVTPPPGTSKQQWLNGLRPFVTDEFFAEMATVDPANSAGAVTGPPTPLRSTATSMDVRLPTDLGQLIVRVNRTPAGWRVAMYDKEG
ncbi:hypothetical protein [Saccharopolyspora rosea]|uniref:Mce-associated membrane protein n=1 Tax=Saccharopolyspora rosea TaxID=524884 RepID=A0ABW3FV42_9PSEU|nr:hypothetical protein [Saccharopolyspora rosea]